MPLKFLRNNFQSCPPAKCNIEFLGVPEAPIIKPQAYLGLRRWQSVIDVAIWPQP